MKEMFAKRGMRVHLGRQGEHLARCIVFDIAQWQALYGEGSVQLLAQRCGDETPYPCAVSVGNGQARWAVREADVAVAGEGRLELQYRVGDTVVKTDMYETVTQEAIGQAGPVPPDPEQGWVETVLQAARAAEESAKDAKEAVTQAITIGKNGNWFIDGEDTGVRATGPRGETGLPKLVELAGAEQSLALANNTEYRCAEPVTRLAAIGFEPGADGKSEVWGVHFLAGETITVLLPDTVVWNYGAMPVFTPGSEYWLLFTPLLRGKVLGVWNEVEA